MWEGRSYQRKKTLLRPKIEWGIDLEREKSVWGGKGSETIERDRRTWEKNHIEALYRNYDSRWIERYWEVLRTNSRQMDLSRCYQEVSTAKWPWWIEKLSSIYWANRNFLNRSRSCREGIETNSQKLRWIEIVITVVEKGRSRGLIDSLAIERYREVVEMLKK